MKDLSNEADSFITRVKTLETIGICNVKSIRPIKSKKMAIFETKSNKKLRIRQNYINL